MARVISLLYGGEGMNYLYNGVELPALPEWDREAYPYAVMVYNGTQYRLVLKGTPFTVTVNSGYVSINPMNYPKYRLVDGAWESFTQFTASWSGVMWANHDLYYADSVADVGGTLYLAASEPIPISTFDKASFLAGLACGLCERGR